MRTPSRDAARPEPVFAPATPERWADLERLFGPNGACGGCWCLWWKRSRAEFTAQRGAGNRAALASQVAAGPPPGVLAYVDGEAVGWIAVEPRSAYPVLQRSPVLKPVDDAPVWSITCLVVARAWRGRGLARPLIEAAVAHAAAHGARIVEGYPVDTTRKLGVNERFTGPLQSFQQAGFREVARRSSTRPILRRNLDRGSS